ncbi:hypothetical protein [Parvularcula maris]|uniref:Uncharacterized protein n=1 Tax=Parvularcula maris TaxID=2965077 RepID=A0A9X2RK31_9PROT|nr:hypothetical protein [Parvularcula maris]MCQ8186511.1 hypothetical protein [Parvularcula maris]
MTNIVETKALFSLEEEIAVAEAELVSATRFARRSEADFDRYGVQNTPHLAALATRLDRLKAEQRTAA